MTKCLIYGITNSLLKHINVIKYYEKCNKLQVIGITDKRFIYDSMYGWKCYKLEDIIYENFDIVVVCANKSYSEIVESLYEYGIDKTKIIPSRVLELYNLDFEKYRELSRKMPTIIPINCWGGLVYHSLGLEMKSPLVNILIHEEDYLKLIRNVKRYFSYKPEFIRMIESKENNLYYPLCKLDDIYLYCLHYHSYEELIDKWMRRVQRVDYDNLFYMISTTSKTVASEFYELKTNNKVAFIPFEDDNRCSVFIDQNSMGERNFDWAVLGEVNGRFCSYDIVELLLNHKYKPYGVIYRDLDNA